MKEEYSDSTHNELIRVLAHDPENRNAWNEFYNRYHQFICTTIYKESKDQGFQEGYDHIEDLAQEAYKKLIKNNCQALKVYQGKHENTIFKYLKIVVIRLIQNRQKEIHAKRRIPQTKTVSLNKPHKTLAGNSPEEEIKSGDCHSILGLMVLREDIEFCLNKIFNNNKQKELYKLILKYYLFEGLDSRLIAESLKIERSQKTISNIISKSMPSLKNCLEQRIKEN